MSGCIRSARRVPSREIQALARKRVTVLRNLHLVAEPGTVLCVEQSAKVVSTGGVTWSGGRDSNSRSPGPKPEAKAYRIQLDLSSRSVVARKSLNSTAGALVVSTCSP